MESTNIKVFFQGKEIAEVTAEQAKTFQGISSGDAGVTVVNAEAFETSITGNEDFKALHDAFKALLIPAAPQTETGTEGPAGDVRLAVFDYNNQLCEQLSPDQVAALPEPESERYTLVNEEGAYFFRKKPRFTFHVSIETDISVSTKDSLAEALEVIKEITLSDFVTRNNVTAKCVD